MIHILILTFFFTRTIPEPCKRVPKKGMLLIKAKRLYILFIINTTLNHLEEFLVKVASIVFKTK